MCQPWYWGFSYMWVLSHSVVCNSLELHGLYPTRHLCPWDLSGKNTGVGCHFLRLPHSIKQSSMCYTVGPCWLSILNIAVCTCPSQAGLSVQFSRSVMSHSLWPHEPQHTRPPCPLSTPGVHPNSCPLSQWWLSNHLIPCRALLSMWAIFPSIRVFSNETALHTRQQKYWSFSFISVLPMNTQDWSPLGWTGWISLQFKGHP